MPARYLFHNKLIRCCLLPLALLSIYGTAMAAGDSDKTAPPTIEQARTLISQGQEPAAIALLQQLVKQQPQAFQAWFLMGITQAKLRRFHDAVTAFKQVSILRPKLAEPHNNLAVIYNELGDLRSAVRELESSLQLKPDYATAHENLGDLYVKLAAESYQNAINLDNKSPVQLRYQRLLHLNDAEPLHRSANAHSETVTLIANGDLPQSTTATRHQQRKIAPKHAEPETTNALHAEGHAASEQQDSAPVSNTRVPARPTTASLPLSDSDADTPPTSAQKLSATGQTPASAHSVDSIRSARAAVEAWRNAWSRKDLPAYFAAYSTQFAFDERFDSLEQWKRYKQWAIKKRAFIQVTLEKIETTMLPGGEIEMVFLQHFRSDSFNSDDIKSLRMQHSQDGWKIVREQSK